MSRIRLVRPSDSAALAALQIHNRTYLAPWEPLRSEDHLTEAGQRAAVDTALDRYEREESAPFVILDNDEVLVGRLTLNGIVRGAFQSCAMSYWVAEEQTGRGFATQAVSAALVFAFNDLGLHRVQAETLLSNSASQRVLHKTGFVRFGLAPRYLKIAGEWQDHLMLQRLADDQ